MSCCQCLSPISALLLAPDAKIAWFWVSNRWRLISDWNLCGPRSQSTQKRVPRQCARLVVAPKNWQEAIINRIQTYNIFTSCIWTCSDNRSAVPCSELLICCSTCFLRICSVHFQDQSESGQGNLPQSKMADFSGYFCSHCFANHSILQNSDFVFVVIS